MKAPAPAALGLLTAKRPPEGLIIKSCNRRLTLKTGEPKRPRRIREMNMEFKRELPGETNSGNYAILITFLSGALGVVYGLTQISLAEAATAGGTVFLMAGALWGVIGLLFGAMLSAAVNGGFWSIPIFLILFFAVQSKITGQ
jgi:hypothetical protein